jgi:ribosomal protein L3 glutamine methyltransferase
VIKHRTEEQVTLYESSLFNGLPPKKYDIIISNPPYVCSEEMTTLPPEYHHEPVQGLKAENQGLEFVLRILQEAHHYLQPHGLLIVEVGNTEQALLEYFPTVNFTWLEFKQGDTGIFLLTQEQLITNASLFTATSE